MGYKWMGAAAVAALIAAAPALAQPAGPPAGAPPRGPITFKIPPSEVPQGSWPKAVTQVIKVHGASLEGNLEGDAVDRDVVVILPPSYAASKTRRYPVIYLMHGFALTAKVFTDYLHADEAVAHAASKGSEFIVVAPDTDTKMGGSMYSSSPTTGDFESFVARDLVRYVDSHYRTIAKRSARGLAGHSMGGYGVWKIGMKHPEPFAAIYAMSACCVSARSETAESAKKTADYPFDKVATADFGAKAALASAAAWSPNPGKPPYYADFAYKDGAVDQAVLAEWAANAPLAMVPQYVPALKSYVAIGADVGDKDGLIKDDTAIHEALNRFGIKDQFAVYDGNHANHIGARFDQAVLPFFAAHLQMK